MPTTLPGLSVTKAAELLQTQDRIIKTFPEVQSAYGKAGRASSATDPAPTEMIETVIALKPKEQWRQGVTIDSLVAEMDAALQFPGVSNAWTMPIKARLDMLATGIRTPVGIKVFGRDLASIDAAAQRIVAAVKTVPGAASVYAERTTGGFALEIEPDRRRLARYGLSVADISTVVASALGGEMLTTTVEGRERYAVNVRYPRASRSDPTAIAHDVLVPLADGSSVPLGEVATIRLAEGPATIRSENAQLAVYVLVDVRGRDVPGFVAEAQRAVMTGVAMPEGTYAVWSGQYEYFERAKARLMIVVPMTLSIVLLLLVATFARWREALIVMLSLPFALVGGVWLLWFYAFKLSVAVVVGFIALAGVAAETGVVMLLYLQQALAARTAGSVAAGRAMSQDDVAAAVEAGAVERLRPKLMTVTAILAGLVPILWHDSTGAEVMSRIAVPMIGGIVSSSLLTLLVIPAIFAWAAGRDLAAPRRRASCAEPTVATLA
jgi:copper/silver efflux system protein